MANSIQHLLNEIISTARDRGISQAKLAQGAGMSAVGLSKAKGRGDIRASHLAALAAQLDLELTLTPTRSREQAIEAIQAGNFFATNDGEPKA